MEHNTWPMGSDGRLLFSSFSLSSTSPMRNRSRDKIQMQAQKPTSTCSKKEEICHQSLKLRPLQVLCPQRLEPENSDSHRDKEKNLRHETASLISDDRVLNFFSSTSSSKHHKNEGLGLEKSFFSSEASQRSISLAFFQENLLSSTSIPKETIDGRRNFKDLPFDVLKLMAGGFSCHNLWAASMVCRSWYQALEPLREAMLFVRWGKKLKHGRGGVSQNLEKALESFLKGAARGCAAAMVDAGLLLWEQGKRDEGIKWYKRAAELGDHAGQCNLGLAYLQEPVDPTEAVKWFQRAAAAGHVRAQYTLAVCLQQGRGIERSPTKAAKWYLRAAEGGSLRAMYNTALCYTSGEGMKRDYREARKWMRRAALAGHHKAQFEHGLTLFAEGDGGLALVFLELATRAGETGATHIRDVLLQQLPPKMRAHAIACADKWHVKQVAP